MTEIRLDGRVVVVTGGGRGLGRSYALGLAARGARVVVNDVGGNVAGEGASAVPAEAVAAEIRASGGEAVASSDDVSEYSGAERLVAAARREFGRVDAVVCNAGILRDRTLLKMSPEEFTEVLRVHLLGSAWVAKAALPVMREQRYGRILVTTSHSGLFGNFGQTNYAAAKLGLVGFILALAQEGAPHGILANAIAPLAVTRLGAGVFPDELAPFLVPEQVAPVVTWLCSEACHVTGQIVLAAGGRVARVALVQTAGFGELGKVLTPEAVAEGWPRTDDMTNAAGYPNSAAAFMAWLGQPAFAGPPAGKTP